MEELEKIIEKIKRLASGGNDTDMVCFIVAFDLLYFLNDTDNRNKFVYNYYKNDNSMFSSNSINSSLIYIWQNIHLLSYNN